MEFSEKVWFDGKLWWWKYSKTNNFFQTNILKEMSCNSNQENFLFTRIRILALSLFLSLFFWLYFAHFKLQAKSIEQKRLLAELLLAKHHYKHGSVCDLNLESKKLYRERTRERERTMEIEKKKMWKWTHSPQNSYCKWIMSNISHTCSSIVSKKIRSDLNLVRVTILWKLFHTKLLAVEVEESKRASQKE